MTDVFNTTTEAPDNETKSFLESLVGDGKKFKSAEELARGKAEADAHIERLNKTLDELREEVTKQDYAKKLLEELEQRKHNEAPIQRTPAPDGQETKPDTKVEVDLDSLVEKALLKKEQERSASQNLKAANEKMEAAFGDKAAQVLQTRAKELGMNVDRLKAIASESPSAFFALMGGQTDTKATSVKSTVTIDNFTNPNERGFQYYQNLRRQNKKAYYTPKVQRQMEADLQRMGKEKFLST